jgi:hypothetical protein
MLVFDPLALLLVVAAQITFFGSTSRSRDELKKRVDDPEPKGGISRLKEKFKRKFLPTPQKDFRVLMDDD